MFARTVGLADGHAGTGLAFLIVRADPAGAATAVGAAFYAFTVRNADRLALVVVTEVIVITEPTIAATAVGATLLVGAVWHAVLTGLIFRLAGTVHGPEHAGCVEVHPALPEDALDQVEELVLGFGSTFVKAVEEALSAGIGDADHGALDKLATGFAREADAILAGLVGSADSAGSAAVVGAAFFAAAIRFADHLAFAAFALVVLGTGTALAAATVGAAFFAGTVGLATATALVAEFHADAVPLHFAAEGVLGADTVFAFAAGAGREGRCLAAVRALAAVPGADGAVFAFLGLADAVAADGLGHTDAEIGALVAVFAEAALVAARVRATLFADALGCADVLAVAIVTEIARLANAALAFAAIVPAFVIATFWHADRDALSVNTVAGIAAITAGSAAAIGSALLAEAGRNAGNAREV